jgi:AraC family transcriptional regulator
VRRIVGRPVASGRVPGRVPLLLEHYQALFDSVSVPPLPAPLLLVHTGGKPLAYLASGRGEARQSIPGFVTFLPRAARTEVSLRGVGEGTVIYLADEQRVPGWFSHVRHREPLTFTNDLVVSLVRQLMRDIETGGKSARYRRVLGDALLAELQRELEQSSRDFALPATRSALRVSHAAVEYMRRHLDEHVTIEVLARQCGLGVTRFSSSFRDSTGFTPHRYLRKLRIERACELLRSTALTVGEVAEAVGFRGQSHFCTAFSAERGLTPSAYRRAVRASTARRDRAPR